MPNDLPYEYVNEDSIPHTLKCGICRQPFLRPVSTKCRKQHKFCRSCIEQWLKNHSTCPTCRQNLTKDDLVSVKEDIVIELLDELPVTCSTCKETNIERVHFRNHLKNTCSMTVTKCPAHDIQCSWQGYEYELESHVQQCPFQALRPLLVSLIDENQALKAQIHECEGHVHRYENQVSQLHVQIHQQTNQIQRQHSDILELQNQLRYNRHHRPLTDRSVPLGHLQKHVTSTVSHLDCGGRVCRKCSKCRDWYLDYSWKHRDGYSCRHDYPDHPICKCT